MRLHSFCGLRFWVAGPLCSLLLVMCGCKHHNGTNGAQRTDGKANNVGTDRASALQQQAMLLDQTTTEMNTDVPATVQRALPAFKNSLVRLADDVMAGQAAGASTAQVQSALQAVMPGSKAPEEDKTTADAKAADKNEYEVPEKGDYGGSLEAVVRAARPGLLLVDIGFGITCGDDHLLLGYSNAGGAWRRVLRWQAAPYSAVSGAFGDMFTSQLLQPKRNGHAVLLVVHGTQWCTSTESAFAMDTFEIDPGAETEKPFWHDEHQYRRADDVPPLAFRLKTTSDGFEVRASVDDRIGDDVNRVGVMRYALVHGTMERVLPIAINSRESVSEWLSMPRDEARQFTHAPPGSAVWRMWEAFTYRDKKSSAVQAMPMLSYGDVRSCSASKHYQVEIRTEQYSADNKSHAPGASEYVQVEETGNGYRIDDVLPQPSPTCQGPVIRLQSSGYGAQPGGE